MNRKTPAFCLLLLVASCLPLLAGEVLPADDVVSKMAARLEDLDRAAEEWGFWQETDKKRFDGDNHVERQKTEIHRTIWLEGKPYMELLKIDGRDLTADERKEEAKRKADFIKKIKKPEKEVSEEQDLSWKEIFQKYDYTLLPSDGQSAHLVAFRPKESGLSERNRMDKVFNHLRGKLWINEDFCLIHATASLTESLSIGWGLLARLDKLNIDYGFRQHENVWMPAGAEFEFSARFIFLKTIRQAEKIRMFDYFPRPRE